MKRSPFCEEMVVSAKLRNMALARCGTGVDVTHPTIVLLNHAADVIKRLIEEREELRNILRQRGRMGV